MTRAPRRWREQAVEEFNQRFPVGSEVMLKKDFELEPIRTKTRSEAFVLSGHSAVVFLEGVSGCYLITHVSEAMPAPDSPLVKPESADLVKIWSFEHDAWWRSDSRGYTTVE